METRAEYSTPVDDQPVPIRDLRTEKRFFVDNVILRGYGPTLGVYGIAVYTALCMHANLQTQQCYPSHRTIADMLDCSVGKVKDAIRTLEELKLIETAPRYDAENKRQTSNLYTILDPPVPPVTTDTRPRYAEMTTNNPHSDQSYLNKKTPPPADSPPSGQKQLERMRANLGSDPFSVAAHTEQSRSEVEHPDFTDAARDADPWIAATVPAWCRIAEKDCARLTDPTRRKLAGIFSQVGAITDRSPSQVAQAIEAFPELHKWWETYDWPTDTFCQRLAGMLIPGAEPEPVPDVVFEQPAWLGVTV
jgi:hypothetical protein